MGLNLEEDESPSFAELAEENQAIFLLLDQEVVGRDNFQKLADHAVHQARFEFKLVFPILLEPCEWENSSLKHIPVYPLNKRPISEWESNESAWQQVLREMSNILIPYRAFYPETAREQALKGIGRVQVENENTYVSGFMIGHKLLLTSRLLIDTEEKAKQSFVTFTRSGILPTTFRLDPDRFFLMDRETGSVLVGVGELMLTKLKQEGNIEKNLTLKIASSPVKSNDILYSAKFKSILDLSLNQNTVDFADGKNIQYSGPLEEGASSSLLLNENFEVVAINTSEFERPTNELLLYNQLNKQAKESTRTVLTLKSLLQSIYEISSHTQSVFLEENIPAFYFEKSKNKWTGLPVILCYFAQNPNQIHLSSIEDEHEQIQLLWERNQSSNNPIPVQYILRSYRLSNSKQVIKDIEVYGRRIVMFQFSGRISGSELIFYDSPTQIGGIANIIGEHTPNLKLVVLNGCSSSGMVEVLLKKGVQAVIGTDGNINDEVAMKFSLEFHKCLFDRVSILSAFNKSISALSFDNTLPGEHRGNLDIDESDNEININLYTAGDADLMLNDPEWWKIHDKPLQPTPFEPKTPISISLEWIFNGNTVLVVGTRNYPMLPIEIETSEAVGHMLAIAEFGLIGGGFPGVDHLVGKTYTEELASKGISEKFFFTQIIYGKADYEGGTTLKIGSEVDWYTQALSKADAVIMIGGLNKTYKTFQKARDKHIPVIPLCTTGGSAERAYHTQKKDFMAMYVQNQKLCNLYARLDYDNLTGKQIAEIVKEMLNDLLFPIPASTSKKRKK